MTPIPHMNPAITEYGVKWMNLEIFNKDMKTKTIPLRNMIENAATKSGLSVDPIINRLINVAIWAAFGAVGPLTPTMHPPNRPPIIPPAIAPQIPATGPNWEISPNARANGRAMIATVIPDRISALILVCIIFILYHGLIIIRVLWMNDIIWIKL